MNQHAPLANEENPPDIRVFLMSGTKLFCDGEAKGIAMRIDPNKNPGEPGRGETNACWILADNLPAIELGEIPRRIAHEMGHVLVGYGHPDEPANRGPAPLPGTDPRIRLMVSGTNNGIAPGELLVKGEWDAAEKWLRRFIDKTN